LLPINGKHVPFNIHTLKSVVKNDEGKYSSLRFNFHLPGTVANLTFPKFNELAFMLKKWSLEVQQQSELQIYKNKLKMLQKKVKLDLS
jgi:nucleosome binding factor SPN SPT16 subunit